MKGAAIGFMEGLAIFLSFSARLFTGIWSDHIHTRKPFIVAGSVLSTLLKPAFAFATGPVMLLSVRLFDRFSKGIRAAPVDAMVSDLSPRANRGAAFGLKQSLKTLGVIAGGGLASLCMYLTGDNYRMTFLIATVPALLSIIFSVSIKQPPLKDTHPKFSQKQQWHLIDIKKLPRSYWQTLVFCMLLFGAYFSEFFITLHLKGTGISLAWLPMIVVAMNLIHAFSAYPFGHISDRVGRQKMLAIGVSVLVLVDVVFGFASSLWMMLIGVVLIGVHMGVTRGLIRATLSEHVPAEVRGTAYAVFYFLTGFSLLGANLLAGKLFDLYGSKGPFWSGGVFAFLSLLCLFWMGRRRR